MIAPRTEAEYRVEARRLELQALAAEDRGDDVGAERLRHRAFVTRRAAEALALRAIGGAA